MIEKMLLQWCRRQAACQRLRHEVQVVEIAQPERRPAQSANEPFGALHPAAETTKRAA